MFKSDKNVEGKGFVLVEGVYSNSASSTAVKVLVMNIYALCSNKDKVLFWKEVEEKLATTSCLTRCVIGDFNSVRNDSERKGMNNGKVNMCELARFSEFIESCSLKEIPVVGRKFTWYRPNGTARSRLDRALVSDEWLLQWSGSK